MNTKIAVYITGNRIGGIECFELEITVSGQSVHQSTHMSIAGAKTAAIGKIKEMSHG